MLPKSLPKSNIKQFNDVGQIHDPSNPNNNIEDDPKTTVTTNLEKKREWFEKRQKMRDRFCDLKSKATEARQRIWIALNNSISNVENSQNESLNESLKECDIQIQHYTSLIRRLSDVTNQAKFDKFCEEMDEANARILAEEQQMQRQRNAEKSSSSQQQKSLLTKELEKCNINDANDNKNNLASSKQRNCGGEKTPGCSVIR